MRLLKIIIAFTMLFSFATLSWASESDSNISSMKFSLSERNLKDVNPGDTTSIFYHLVLANNTLTSSEATDKNMQALAKLFFSKDLYKLYWHEKKMDESYFKAKGDEGCVTFNPVIGGQDIPYGFYIDPYGKTHAKTAVVTVNLKYSTNSIIAVHLLKIDGVWKIDDIDYPNKTSMRGKLQECLGNPKYKPYS